MHVVWVENITPKNIINRSEGPGVPLIHGEIVVHRIKQLGHIYGNTSWCQPHSPSKEKSVAQLYLRSLESCRWNRTCQKLCRTGDTILSQRNSGPPKTYPRVPRREWMENQISVACPLLPGWPEVQCSQNYSRSLLLCYLPNSREALQKPVPYSPSLWCLCPTFLHHSIKYHLLPLGLRALSSALLPLPASSTSPSPVIFKSFKSPKCISSPLQISAFYLKFTCVIFP